MVTNTTELLDHEHKHDTRGRRIADETRRAAVLAGYAGSGLTQAAYAKREGINYHTFVAWLGQSRRERGEPTRRTARASLFPATFATTTTPRFAEVRVSAPSQSLPLEVVLPDGMIVRGVDPAALLTVIRSLRS